MSAADRSGRAMGYGSIAAGVLIGLGFVIHPEESTDAVRQFAAVAADPNRWYAAHLLLFAGLGCTIASLLLLMRLLGATSPSAALGWGIVALAGLVSAIGFISIDAVVFWTLARPGLDPATVRAVFDELTRGAGPQAMFAPAALLNIGVFALAVGLYQSRTVPRWISATIAASMVVQMVFSLTYVHVAATLSGVLIAVGFVGLGFDALRRSATVQPATGRAVIPTA